jgi:hypothetical protein
MVFMMFDVFAHSVHADTTRGNAHAISSSMFDVFAHSVHAGTTRGSAHAISSSAVIIRECAPSR